jgi:hypothetical protein
MVCEPTINVLVVSAAWAFVNVPVPRIVAPSRNVIVPVAPEGAVAVNVTAWSTVEGLSDDVTVTVGAVFTTVTEAGGEIAGLLFASPGVLAVIWLVPSGSVLTVIVAVPPTIVAVPIAVPPFENVTGPETPGGTVSVIVTGVPTTGLVDEGTGIGNTGVALFTVCESVVELAALLFESPP